ncbi:MAG: PrsW family intrarane metalloprotease [Segetibacter sp.]|nr:PrsW family intrarane metalloprotease [Segetibacter sp.]
MYVFAIALAPAILIMLFIYLKDRYNKEPLIHLAVCFFLGVISAVPVIYIERFTGNFLDTNFEKGLVHTLLKAFIVVALAEEFGKYCMLRWYAYPKKAFDEPFDGIVYSIFVSMGFAVFENLGYVYRFGSDVGILRMFLTVPAHASFAVLMGYYVGLAKFHPSKAVWLRTVGLFWAVVFHGAYDCFLFLGENKVLAKYVSAGLLVLGAFVSYGYCISLSFKAIRKHHNLSRNKFEKVKTPVV